VIIRGQRKVNIQVEQVLDRCTAIFSAVLGEDLAGIYLHGSLAMGCFNPGKSDIDILVVIRKRLTHASAIRIAGKLLSLRDEIANGLEISVIREDVLSSVSYPTPCELHFSDYHRERYRTVEDYICGGYEDGDLASQIASKREGGEWGLKSLPLEYREIVRIYLNRYKGVSEDRQVHPDLLAAFAEYMLDEIDKEVAGGSK
jgi:predicted nucleotidyltransferase